MEKKISFLQKLRDYKEILDGKFSDKVSSEKKQQAWEELLQYAKSIGMVSESCTKEKLRDTTWGNWKRRAKEKLDKSRQTGSGKVILTELDNLVLDILGRNTPGVIGMTGVSSDSEDTDEDKCISVVATNSSSSKTNKGITKEDPPKPTPEKEERVINSKSSCSKTNNVERHEGRYKSPPEKKIKSIDDEIKVLDKQKKIAQIKFLNASADLADAQKYKTQLECLALERQLQLPSSAVTANLMTDSNLSQVPEVLSFPEDENLNTVDGKIYRNLN